MEITINQKKFSDMWCPFGRINIQRIDKGMAEVTPAAFNAVITGNDGKLYLSARCQGDACPFYKKPFLGKIGWGGCRFCKNSVGWGVLIPWWIIALTGIAAVYLKYFGGVACN